MAPFRFAVFGDSYVKRQERFGAAFQFPDHSTVRFFGRGGMCVISDLVHYNGRVYSITNTCVCR